MLNNNDMLRRMMSGNVTKPVNLGATMARFWQYFRHHWTSLVIVLVLVITSTWAQVTTPELIGQTVDCYLTPATTVATSGAFPGLQATSNAQSNCWLAADATPGDGTHQLIKSVFLSGNHLAPSPSLTNDQRIEGLGRLTLFIAFFYIVGAILSGLTFFTMSFAGQQVLREMRIDVFKQLHRLSLGFYSKNDAGDLMSRITTDAEAIQQALGFAFVNVFSGILLLLWIAYNMLTKSVPFALLSMIVLPIMIVATFWFSGQARKAFRASRAQMGSVNTELQETISSVREVQAFNRADENIEGFKKVNAANRDANVRAVSFTSALAPALEALGYVALAIVVCVGGTALLGGGTLFALKSRGIVMPISSLSGPSRPTTGPKFGSSGVRDAVCPSASSTTG